MEEVLEDNLPKRPEIIEKGFYTDYCDFDDVNKYCNYLEERIEKLEDEVKNQLVRKQILRDNLDYSYKQISELKGYLYNTKKFLYEFRAISIPSSPTIISQDIEPECIDLDFVDFYKNPVLLESADLKRPIGKVMAIVVENGRLRAWYILEEREINEKGE